MNWYMQSNISEKDFIEFKNIAEKLSLNFIPFFHIPFDNSYPELNKEDSLFVYASSSVTDNIYNSNSDFSGVFNHTSEIDIRNFFKNSPCNMWSDPIFIGALDSIPELNEKDYFIRPVIDDKWLAGSIMSYSDILIWIDKLKNVDFDLTTEVLISTVNYPSREYRMFCVDGKIVASSMYRKNMIVETQEGSPLELQEFALSFIKENTEILPKAFVIDIAESENKVGVIEINGINNSGFYDINKLNLVESLIFLCKKIALQKM